MAKTVNHKPPYHCKEYFLPALPFQQYITSSFDNTYLYCPMLPEYMYVLCNPKKSSFFYW